MFLRKIATAVAITTLSTSAWAACSFDNDIELKSLSNSFDAMKAVTDAMAECGNMAPRNHCAATAAAARRRLENAAVAAAAACAYKLAV